MNVADFQAYLDESSGLHTPWDLIHERTFEYLRIPFFPEPISLQIFIKLHDGFYEVRSIEERDPWDDEDSPFQRRASRIRLHVQPVSEWQQDEMISSYRYKILTHPHHNPGATISECRTALHGLENFFGKKMVLSASDLMICINQLPVRLCSLEELLEDGLLERLKVKFLTRESPLDGQELYVRMGADVLRIDLNSGDGMRWGMTALDEKERQAIVQEFEKMADFFRNT